MPLKEERASFGLEDGCYQIGFLIIHHGYPRFWVEEAPLQSWWVGSIVAIRIDLRRRVSNGGPRILAQLFHRRIGWPILIHVNPLQQMPERGRKQHAPVVGNASVGDIEESPSNQMCAPPGPAGLFDYLPNTSGGDGVPEDIEQSFFHALPSPSEPMKPAGDEDG